MKKHLYLASLLLSLLLNVSFTLAAKMPAIGFSGMTQMSDNRFLVVMDKKSHKDGPRVGILDITEKEGQIFTPVIIDDWKHPDGQASDLESACKLPHRENEYLVAESGYWKGRNGRIFKLVMNEQDADVAAAYPLPQYQSNDEGIDGDNFEGMLCFASADKTYVMLGERGGSQLYPTGVLRLGVITDDSIQWFPPEKFAQPISPTGAWSQKNRFRSISDLYLDGDNIIWATATEDKGDLGPFNSFIYAIGRLEQETGEISVVPVSLNNWEVLGLKIEALAGPATLTPGALLSYGSEDEDLGGVWRPFSP